MTEGLPKLSFKERREAKLLAKKHECLSLYYEEDLKPAEIARRLKSTRDFVYQCVATFKRGVKRLEQKQIE